MERESYVYFFTTEGKVKIGKANDVKKRFQTTKTYCPTDLELTGYIECENEKAAFELEKKIHEEHADKRLNGEWFEIDVAKVDRMLDKYSGQGNYNYTLEEIWKLPYGSYVTNDNKEVLFNRRYQPMMGYDHVKQKPFYVEKKMWIDNVSYQTWLWDDKTHPSKDKHSMEKCLRTLRFWENREYTYEAIFNYGDRNIGSAEKHFGHLKEGEEVFIDEFMDTCLPYANGYKFVDHEKMAESLYKTGKWEISNQAIKDSGKRMSKIKRKDDKWAKWFLKNGIKAEKMWRGHMEHQGYVVYNLKNSETFNVFVEDSNWDTIYKNTKMDLSFFPDHGNVFVPSDPGVIEDNGDISLAYIRENERIKLCRIKFDPHQGIIEQNRFRWC